jgi:hypothetical protein
VTRSIAEVLVIKAGAEFAQFYTDCIVCKELTPSVHMQEFHFTLTENE